MPYVTFKTVNLLHSFQDLLPPTFHNMYYVAPTSEVYTAVCWYCDDKLRKTNLVLEV
jgi:hypothetical protein